MKLKSKFGHKKKLHDKKKSNKEKKKIILAKVEDWFDWSQADDDLPENESLEIVEHVTPDLKEDAISWGAACPADVSIPISMQGVSSTLVFLGVRGVSSYQLLSLQLLRQHILARLSLFWGLEHESNFIRSYKLASIKLCKKVLVGAGVTVVSGAVINIVLTAYINKAIAASSQIDSTYLGLLSISGLDHAISIIIGALIARATLLAANLSFKKRD